MRLLITLILASVMASSCSSQNKFDLQKMTFNEDVKEILKGKKKFSQERDVLTTLPTFYTYEMQHFKYGNIEFANKDIANDNPSSAIYFLLKDTVTPYQIKGVMINTDIKKEGDALIENLKKEYGNPKMISTSTISEETKNPNGSNCYLWQNAKNNHSILCVQSHNKIDNKEVLSTEIVFIDSNIIDKDPDSKRTVLDRIIQTYKN